MTQESQPAGSPPGNANNLPGYRLLRRLGKGGMATVYLAVQENFGREVALKVMAPHLAKEPGFAERFLREARIVAQLAHPHIVVVHDVGAHRGYHYIAMEYHPGGNLHQRIKEGLTPHEALRITRQLADALAFAHSKGFVHRDLKPDNVLFRQHNDDAILTDFGIAKAVQSDTQLTQLGTAVGTPKYMSPEQARGEAVDGRSDLYSLGVMLFEMLTGQPPYLADDAFALAIKHMQDPIPRLSTELARYQPLVDRLLGKKPAERPARAEDVVPLIDALLRPGTPVAAASATPRTTTSSTASTLGAIPIPTAAAVLPLEAQFEVNETSSGNLLFRRYQVAAAFTAADWADFQGQLQKLQDSLGETLAKRGKKLDAVTMTVTAHPWIHGRVREVVQAARLEGTPLGRLLEQARVTLTLRDEQQPEGETRVLSEGKA